MPSEIFDIVVVGGGPAGLATAVYLKQHHKQSVIVLSKIQARHAVGEVLSPIIKEELVRLGIYDEFLKSNPVRSSGVSVWWGGRGQRGCDYIFNPHGYGWHVERHSFNSLLLRQAKFRGVRTIDIQSAERFQVETDKTWRINVLDSEGNIRQIEAAFLVNASGRSRVLSCITGQKSHHDRLIGCYQYIVGTHSNRLWEWRLWIESTPNGWFYSAPLPGGKGIVVFLSDGDLISGNISEFVRNELLHAPNTLSRLCQASPRGLMGVCSARSGIVPPFKHPNAITVGDASYTTDPIRGYGILQSFRQAREACDVVSQYLSGGHDSARHYYNVLKERYDNYCNGLSSYYGLEDRWSDNLFWKRRIAGAWPNLDIETGTVP